MSEQSINYKYFGSYIDSLPHPGSIAYKRIKAALEESPIPKKYVNKGLDVNIPSTLPKDLDEALIQIKCHEFNREKLKIMIECLEGYSEEVYELNEQKQGEMSEKIEELEREQEESETEKDGLRSTIEELEGRITELESSKREIEGERDGLVCEKDELEETVDNLECEITILEDKIKAKKETFKHNVENIKKSMDSILSENE